MKIRYIFYALVSLVVGIVMFAMLPGFWNLTGTIPILFSMILFSGLTHS